MNRPCRCAVLAAVLASLIACDDEGGAQGQRGPCASSAGSFAGCADEPIETIEDACWRLVECGVIPLEQHDPDRQWVTDWDECVRDLYRLTPEREQFVLSCIEAATCDDLRLPGRGGEPLCFDFGDLDN